MANGLSARRSLRLPEPSRSLPAGTSVGNGLVAPEIQYQYYKDMVVSTNGYPAPPPLPSPSDKSDPSRTLLGPFSDPSRTLLGPFSDPSRTLLGPFSDHSRTLLGPFSESSRTLLGPFSDPSRTLLGPFSDPSRPRHKPAVGNLTHAAMQAATSATTPPYLRHIFSAISRPSLGCLSAISRLSLGHLSAISRQAATPACIAAIKACQAVAASCLVAIEVR